MTEQKRITRPRAAWMMREERAGAGRCNWNLNWRRLGELLISQLLSEGAREVFIFIRSCVHLNSDFTLQRTFAAAWINLGERYVPEGINGCKASFCKSPHFLFCRERNPPLIIVRVAGGHTSGWVLCTTCREYGRKALPSHVGDKYDFKAIKACFSGRGSVQHAGDSPSIFLVVFIFFFKVH